MYIILQCRSQILYVMYERRIIYHLQNSGNDQFRTNALELIFKGIPRFKNIDVLPLIVLNFHKMTSTRCSKQRETVRDAPPLAEVN